MNGTLDSPTVGRLQRALDATAYTSGTTHHFYHYPARFSPEVARGVIETFSAPGDWILDPFMGGGTTVIEGLVSGRKVVGVDINALAHFVADVRTRPLSPADCGAIRTWADRCAAELASGDPEWLEGCNAVNLPTPVEVFTAGALARASGMLPRRLRFARCALLRLGQWALDCRDFAAPRRKRLARRLPELVEEMLAGLDEFVQMCAVAGVNKRAISKNRLLFHRSSVGLERARRIVRAGVRPTLVFTSPPYPAVHVLYHRWQYRGRKETNAPYWIANVHDGYGTSFYCGGSRTPTGVRNYFQLITGAFTSVRKVIADDAVVVQLVGFSDVRTQLHEFLVAMDRAGFAEIGIRLTRRVPNRKWYNRVKDTSEAMEYMLIHQPRRS